MMLAVRYVKISLLATTALFLLITVFNNVTDYGSNLNFVKNVLSMTDTFPGNSLRYRAITSPVVHHLGYLSIILWELLGGVFCGLGCWKLVQASKADAATFQRAKSLGLVGYGISLLLWYLAFMTIGGQWFAMWQSDQWNGQDAAGRLFFIMGIGMIFLSLRDDELDPSPAKPANLGTDAA